MPLGYNQFASSDTTRVGTGYTRFRGPLLLGQTRPSANVEGKSDFPPHIVNVSSAPIDIIPAHGTQLSSTPTQGFVYITQTTSVVVTSSGGGILSAPAPAVLGGVALVWDSGRNKICAFSTVANAWLSVTLTSS